MKNFKKIFLIIASILLLFSCSEKSNFSSNLLPEEEKIITKKEKLKNIKNNSEIEKKIKEKIKKVEKKLKKIEKKKVELKYCSGSYEEKIKGDLEKMIVENVGKAKKKDINSIANGIGENYISPIKLGKIQEIYETDDAEIKFRDTEFSYKIDFSETNLLKFDSIIKNNNTFIFKGKLNCELNKIVVSYENDKTKFKNDFYTLKDFDYGKENFSYKINHSFKNLDLGLNKYEIMAFSGDNYEVLNLEIQVDSLKELTRPVSKIKIGKYCLLDSCLEEKYGKIEEVEEKYVQRLENGNINYLFKDKSFGFENLGVGEKEKKVFTSKFKDFYIRTYYKNIGNNGQIKQEFFNNYGYKIKTSAQFSPTGKEIASKIKIGNYNFDLDFNIENNIGDDILFINNKEFSDSNEIKKYIEDLLKNEKKIYREYIFLINSDKQIYLSYKGNIKKPERIIYLGNDEEWLKQSININGELLDLELSNKILGYYGIDSDKMIKDSAGDILFEITEEQIPVFVVKKFDNSGNYMLYLVEKYMLE